MKRTPMPPRAKPMMRSGISLVRSGFRPRPSKTKAASNSALRAVRPLLMVRADGLCEKCGQYLLNGIGEAHHRLKRRGPDRDVLSNLLLVHNECHLAMYPNGIHRSPELARANGWILSAYQEPTTSPVMYRGRLVLLTDDGQVIQWNGEQHV